CSLCYEVSDRNGAVQAQAAIAENQHFIRYAAQDSSGRVAGMMGLHASFTLSDATLDQAMSCAVGAGCHIHVAEGREDQQDCFGKYGKSVVTRLAERGVLGPLTIAVHGVHTDAAEIALLKASDTIVVHNPESNMGNAVGCPPTMQMLAQGLLCGLGTDGYTNDMLESYKVANLLHKHALEDCNAAWTEAPAMLFVHNPAIAARFFPGTLGVLEPQATADVIICDYQPLTPMDATNADSHILFGLNGRGVTGTIAAGKVLMWDRQLTMLDEERIIATAREQAAALWRRINSGGDCR
ncbi:MAG: amidohydrolase family protein, partial [Clostridiales bacterium]